MVDIVGTAKGFIPDINAGSVVGVITVFVLFIVFAIGISIATYLVVRRMKFNKRIVIFEKVGGNFEATRKDAGMFQKVGQGGDLVLYLRKHKKFLPIPSIQAGRNTYWYFIRKDQEWINFRPKDFDEQSREVGAHFVDVDMRYARVGLQRNLRERYDKPSFLSKYGGIIVFTAFVVFTGIMIWLSFDKFLDIVGKIGDLLETSSAVNAQAERIMVALDNICGGRGYTPA